MVRAVGEVTEWLKVRDWKSRGRVKPPRGFESHPLRSGAAQGLFSALWTPENTGEPKAVTMRDQYGEMATAVIEART